ncbi:uncharacterized protein LOC111628656 [Centruroides sculpturatus]|uniref:uncharacterized protein LOC111628656 n=1 Tax=Centruroides sculpturatus TaxID=218467 RepID=UPI000C6CD244|nr:uncharacterized protein LOC111628656 [Centruroides sculpturatus]
MDIFTDGSKHDGMVGSSYVVYINNIEAYNKVFRLHENCTIFQAELYAIKMAITWIKETQNNAYIHLYTDSYSAYNIIFSSKLHPLVEEIRNLLRISTCTIKILWVKAHQGVTGNERADILAKQAAENTNLSIEYNKLSMKTLKRLIWEETFMKWQNDWNENNSHITYKFIPNLKQFYNLKWFSPNYNTTQVLTNHGKFASYLTRFTNRGNDLCPTCSITDGSEHYLYHCVMFTRERLELRLLMEERGIIWPGNLSDIWTDENIYKAFTKLANSINTINSQIIVLCCTSLGADKSSMLRLYRALVRSKLDYGCIVYGSARESTLQMLDPIHHKTLCVCTGAFRTSPVQIDCTVLDTQLKRLFEACPISVPTFNIRMENRFGHSQTSCRGKKACAQCGNEDHESNECTSSPCCVNCKDAHPAYSRKCPSWQREKEIQGLKTINNISYSEARRMITLNTPVKQKTFAAALKSTKTCGVQTDISVSLDESLTRHEKCLLILSTKATEKENNKAKPLIPKTGVTTRKVGSKKASKNPLNKQRIKAALSKTKKSETQSMSEFSDFSDEENNKGVTPPTSPPKEKPPWQNMWNAQVHNKLHEIKPTIENWTRNKQYDRRSEVILCRLRIGHTRLTHQYLLKGADQPVCEYCNCFLSVKHILCNCIAFDQNRKQHFGNASLREILGQRPNLDKILNFLKVINICKEI